MRLLVALFALLVSTDETFKGEKGDTGPIGNALKAPPLVVAVASTGAALELTQAGVGSGIVAANTGGGVTAAVASSGPVSALFANVAGGEALVVGGNSDLNPGITAAPRIPYVEGAPNLSIAANYAASTTLRLPIYRVHQTGDTAATATCFGTDQAIGGGCSNPPEVAGGTLWSCYLRQQQLSGQTFVCGAIQRPNASVACQVSATVTCLKSY